MLRFFSVISWACVLLFSDANSKGLPLGSIQGDLAKLIRRFAVGCLVQHVHSLKEHVFHTCDARRFGCLLLVIKCVLKVNAVNWL